jgi:hypothetical protein
MTGRIIYTSARSRHRKRPRFNLRLGAILAALAFISAASIYVLRYPEWQLLQINVSGTRSLLGEEIKSIIWEETSESYARLIPKRSIFLLKEKDLASKLKQEFPRIREVSFERDLPAGLLVSIVEREPWAIACNDNFTPENPEDVDCVFVDLKGVAFDQAPDSTGSLVIKIKTNFPKLSLGEPILDTALAEYLQNFGKKIESGIGSKVIVYELSSVLAGEFRMTLNDGFALIVTKGADAENVLKILKTVLEEEVKEKRMSLEYVDLRFGNKVFYRFKK